MTQYDQDIHQISPVRNAEPPGVGADTATSSGGSARLEMRE
jgi:hypothetical protein